MATVQSLPGAVRPVEAVGFLAVEAAVVLGAAEGLPLRAFVAS